MARDPYGYDPSSRNRLSSSMLGAAPAPTTAPPRLSGEQAYSMLDQQMASKAAGIESEEYQRYGRGLGAAQSAFDTSQKTLSELMDPDLFFSQASDSIGAQAGGQVDALRRSLGARGLNPNSGAAGGLLSKILFQRDQSLAGANLQSQIEAQKMRQAAAATNFAQALNLAGYINSPVPQIGLDVMQNKQEQLLAREGLHNQRESNKEANRSGTFGDVITGLTGLGKLIF